MTETGVLLQVHFCMKRLLLRWCRVVTEQMAPLTSNKGIYTSEHEQGTWENRWLNYWSSKIYRCKSSRNIPKKLRENSRPLRWLKKSWIHHVSYKQSFKCFETRLKHKRYARSTLLSFQARILVWRSLWPLSFVFFRCETSWSSGLFGSVASLENDQNN